MEYTPFDRIRATFRPKKTDDLKPGVAELVGERLEFEAGFEIEAGRPYAGQLAWYPVGPKEKFKDKPMVGWMPTEDLEEIEVIVPRGGMAMEEASPNRNSDIFLYSANHGIEVDPDGQVKAWRPVRFGAPSPVAPQDNPLNRPLEPSPTVHRFGKFSFDDPTEPMRAAIDYHRTTPISAALPKEEIDQYKSDLRKLGLDAPVIFAMKDGRGCFMWPRKLTEEETKTVEWYMRRRFPTGPIAGR